MAAVLPLRPDSELREEGRLLGAREAEAHYRAEVGSHLSRAELQVHCAEQAKVKAEQQYMYVKAQLESEAHARIEMERNMKQREEDLKREWDAKGTRPQSRLSEGRR